MKILLITLLLLPLIPLVVVHSEKSDAGTRKRSPECSMAYWRPDSKVSVYFVRGMFTSEQQQVLVEAMRSWQGAAKRTGAAVGFDYAGETDGLIDCENCLTVARQDAYTNDRRGHTSLNALRRNVLGQLISAWIGIDREIHQSAGLRGLMLEALGARRGMKAVSTCSL